MNFNCKILNTRHALTCYHTGHVNDCQTPYGSECTPALKPNISAGKCNCCCADKAYVPISGFRC